MRRTLHFFIAALMVAFAAPAFAQITEDFEPVQGSSLSKKDILIQQNWQFPDFDINPEGALPIGGTQSMGSGPSYKADQVTGIVTPYLKFSGNDDVSFRYKISRGISSQCRRWFLVYVGDSLGNGYLVDSVEVGNTLDATTYSKHFSSFLGTYFLYINVKGDGCYSKYVIDDFFYSGTIDINVNRPALISFNQSNTGSVNNVNLANNTSGHNSTITLFPNPASNMINLNLTAVNSETADLEVYNIDGSKVLSQKNNLNSGSNHLKMDVSSLVPGNYIISIKTATEVINERFVRVQ